MSDNKTNDELFKDWLGVEPLKLTDPVVLPQTGVFPNSSIIAGTPKNQNWDEQFQNVLPPGYAIQDGLGTQLECEPLRTSIRDYLDEKGLEYSTGGYVEHQVPTGNDVIQLQLTIRNISKKMMNEVVGPALAGISREENTSIELVMKEGDDSSNSCVVVRFRK